MLLDSISRRTFLAAVGLVLLPHDTAAKKKRKTRRAKSPVPILAHLASMHVHGTRDEALSWEQMEARIAAGNVVELRCGYIAQLGVRTLQRAGIPARLVGTLTREPWDFISDGHTMLEARTAKGWTLYDLTGNRAAPPGVGVVQQCALGERRRWLPLAADTLCIEQCDLLAQPGFDARILQCPAIMYEGIYYFRDAGMRARMESLGGYAFASKTLWQRLNH